MTEGSVRAAYGKWAPEYVRRMGAIDQMHDDDRSTIARWALSSALKPGRVLDAGCGPGHWTAELVRLGCEAEGLDAVAEFIEGARGRYPDVAFRLGSLAHIDADNSSYVGVLAWYSLIHATPEEVPTLLTEIRRVLTPGGGLLVGFFDGEAGVRFPHRVVDAFFWSVEAMSALLADAGFEVTGFERRHDEGKRPHAAVTAIAV